MEKIFSKYRDEYGYIINLEDLYKQLKRNNYDIKDIIQILNSIKVSNYNILKELIISNKNREKLAKRKDNIEINNYIKKDKEKKYIDKIKKERDHINILFYIEYINSKLENDEFLNILPKDNNKESLNIIDSILINYLKEIKFLEYILITEKDDINFITNELIKYKYIFNKIMEYKKGLCIVLEDSFKNNLIYFMDNDIPYVFKEILNDIDNIKSILKLLKSIENGNFLNIKAFTNNDKFKGLFEVRDLSKRNRVIFEFIGNGKCSIICSIINKTDANSKYKDNLYNHIKKYRDNINNIKSIEINDIKRLILGDSNE